MANNSNGTTEAPKNKNELLPALERVKLTDPNNPSDVVWLHQIRKTIIDTFGDWGTDVENELLQKFQLIDNRSNINQLNKYKRPLGIVLGGGGTTLVYMTTKVLKDAFKMNASLFMRIDSVIMFACAAVGTVALANVALFCDRMIKQAMEGEKIKQSAEVFLANAVLTKDLAGEIFMEAGKKLLQSSLPIVGFVGRSNTLPRPIFPDSQP